MDKVNTFTVENVKGIKWNGEGAITKAISIKGILTGKSNVYFNKEIAFSSAKNLFSIMGHELIRVSQISQFAGMPLNVFNKTVKDIMEFHVYNYQAMIGGESNMSSFTPKEIGSLMKNNPTIFSKLNPYNFSWSSNHNFTLISY